MSQPLSTSHKLTIAMLIVTWLAMLTVCITFEVYLKDILIPSYYVILLWVILAADSIITTYLLLTSFRCCHRARFQSGSDRNIASDTKNNAEESGKHIIRVDDTDDPEESEEIHSFAE